jgi:hypothetical protein
MKNLETNNSSDRLRHMSLGIEQLQQFEPIRIALGEQFGDQLNAHPGHVALFASQSEINAAHVYKHILGKAKDSVSIHECENPMEQASQIEDSDVIPLVIHSATDPMLKDKLFGQAGFGELLADSFPVVSNERTASPILHCVGITRHGIQTLNMHAGQKEKSDRSQALKLTMGDILTPADFQTILRSPTIVGIHIHALGPEGTNIAQASRLYAHRLGIQDKTQIVVHDIGITPLEYAQIAAQKTEEDIYHNGRPTTLHLHVECAVYNNMGKLYEQRKTESVFADTQNMALDTMQLASFMDIDALNRLMRSQGVVRIATHPSPKPLIDTWVKRGVAQWIEASSNSAAALMVRRGQADACVTTASTVALMQKDAVQTLHEFGSPNMIFTIASPLSGESLKKLLEGLV